jgi:hypothetical protein
MTQIQPVGHGGERGLVAALPMQDFKLLDKYAGGLTDEPVRVAWLATISAGYLVTTDRYGKPLDGKEGRGQPYPAASRKKDAAWIHMTDEDMERAPGLAAVLEANGWRWLDVAVAGNDPSMFLQMHFEKRTSGRLEAHGDEHQIVEIITERHADKNGRPVYVLKERLTHMAGTPRYEQLALECNVTVSFFFVLARWENEQPHVYFPASDGLGVYRLRFTSRNSLRQLRADLLQVSDLTQGQLAGLPLRLYVDFRPVADQAGVTRDIVVWKLRFMPPAGLDLTPELWQNLAALGIKQGQMLRLPLPALETLEDAERTFDVDLDRPGLPIPSAQAVASLAAGGKCDADFYQGAWFQRVKGSDLDSNEARAEFLLEHTQGQTKSLIEFLSVATEDEAARLIAAAGKRIGDARVAKNSKRYDEIFGDDAKGTTFADGGIVNVASGEVLRDPEPRPAPRPERPQPQPQQRLQGMTSQDELAENRRLTARARELGVTGLDPLGGVPAGVPIAQANAELARRIREAERLAAMSAPGPASQPAASPAPRPAAASPAPRPAAASPAPRPAAPAWSRLNRGAQTDQLQEDYEAEGMGGAGDVLVACTVCGRANQRCISSAEGEAMCANRAECDAACDAAAAQPEIETGGQPTGSLTNGGVSATQTERLI